MPRYLSKIVRRSPRAFTRVRSQNFGSYHASAGTCLIGARRAKARLCRATFARTLERDRRNDQRRNSGACGSKPLGSELELRSCAAQPYTQTYVGTQSRNQPAKRRISKLSLRAWDGCHEDCYHGTGSPVRCRSSSLIERYVEVPRLGAKLCRFGYVPPRGWVLLSGTVHIKA